jgi:DNA-binding XRE family transcriptional regulator
VGTVSGYRPTVTLDTAAPVVFTDKIPDPTIVKPRRRKDSGVGARLRELRETRGLSQVEVARRMGCDRSWVSNLERGIRGIKLLSVLRYCDAIGARIHIRLDDTAHTEPASPERT